MVFFLSGDGAGDVARACYMAGYRVLGARSNKSELVGDGQWWVEPVGRTARVILSCAWTTSAMEKIDPATEWTPVGDWMSANDEYGLIIEAKAPGLFRMRNYAGTVEVTVCTAEWNAENGYWTGTGRKEWI
jgi:hypothetical protein